MRIEKGYINFHTHHLQSEHFSLYNYIVKDGTEEIPKQPFSAGIHPWFIHDLEQQQTLLEKISGDVNCIAIGESGLDHECKTPLETQEKAFVLQCRLALELKKPMVLHVVKSHFDAIKIMKEEGVKNAVFHGYNNRYTILEKVLTEGFSVSLGGAIENEHSPAAALLPQIPKDKLFLETDDSHWSIEEIYALAAKKLNLPVETLQEQITANFNRLMNQ